MKRLRTLFICVLATLSLSAQAQSGRMLNRNDQELSWSYIERIRAGQNIPTTVQSLSAEEAAYYGLIPSQRPAPEAESKPFLSPRALIQPFTLGWSGLESSQWKDDDSRRVQDFPLLTRLSLAEPILMIGVSFGWDSLYATSQIDFTSDSQLKYADESGILGFWQPDEYLSWVTFPTLAYMSWSSNWTTVSAGRLQTGIGLGQSNLFLNGQAPWYDHIQFSWWTDSFRFFSLWGTSSSQLSAREWAVQSWMEDTEGNNKSWGWDTENNHDASSQAVAAVKMFTYHRLEFTPFSRLGLGVSEMQMIGGKNPELMNMLPLVYWHNTYTPGTTNVMAMADIWSVPFAGLLLWMEFVMDDSKSASESGESKPNCWAWEAGTSWVLPLTNPRWRFTVNLEYSHADKWTYNRWQPYLTMYQRQVLTGGWDGLDIPLGHPEGGDVDQIGLRFVAMTRNGKKIEASYTWISKGPVYLGRIEEIQVQGETRYIPVYYDYDSWTSEGELDRLIGNTRKHSHVIALSLVWPVGKNWSLKGDVDYRLILNAAHVKGRVDHELVWKAGAARYFGK